MIVDDAPVPERRLRYSFVADLQEECDYCHVGVSMPSKLKIHVLWDAMPFLDRNLG